MARYKTLGLVWFDKTQHNGIFHQDWRIEDSQTAEDSFRLGVRDELAPDRVSRLNSLNTARSRRTIPFLSSDPSAGFATLRDTAGETRARRGRLPRAALDADRGTLEHGSDWLGQPQAAATRRRSRAGLRASQNAGLTAIIRLADAPSSPPLRDPARHPVAHPARLPDQAEAAETDEPRRRPAAGPARARRPVPAAAAIILTIQVVLSVRLMRSNSAFNDEALYLWAGRLEWSHWLHHTAVPPLPVLLLRGTGHLPADRRDRQRRRRADRRPGPLAAVHARRHRAAARAHQAHLRPAIGRLRRRAVRRARLDPVPRRLRHLRRDGRLPARAGDLARRRSPAWPPAAHRQGRPDRARRARSW